MQRKVNDYNAGRGSLHLEDGYNCKLCKNKGQVSYVGENDAFGYPAEYIRPCECWKIRNAIRSLYRSGLKDMTKKCTFDRYKAEESWQQTIKGKALGFCQETRGVWFYIGGQSGAGKSHICTAMTVQLIRQGKAARYMVWRDEVPRIKALVNEPDQYAAIMKELKETDVLYIDDLFKDGKDEFGQYKQPTAADVKLAFEIINYRYNNPALVTIVSSERTMAELDAIDEAVAGRIKERAEEYCISLARDRKKNWRMKGVTEL